jgi:molybdopterin synthase catalytic subunit
MSVTTGLSGSPLDVALALKTVSDPACGGIGVFVGTVRRSAAVESNEAKPVTELEYEAHPTLAGERLVQIAEEARIRWGLEHVFAQHRIGTCSLGEPTVIVACSAPHRAEALEACRWIIDAIKSSVPIWKQEIYADGTAWVGLEAKA